MAGSEDHGARDSGSGRTHSGRRWILGLLLFAQFAGAVYALTRIGPSLWADRWVQDDAYVSFRYAKHFVEGNGLVYNIGQRVEGYSNFLWTMLSAIPIAIGAPDPLPFMHFAGITLWAASFALLLLLGVRLFREGHWAAPLAPIPLAFHWSYNMWFVSGMETPLVSFLLLAMLLLFARDPKRHPATLGWAAACGVALCMTRPDGPIALAGLAAAGILLSWRPLLLDRQWRTYLLLPALPILVVYLPYTLWRLWYYGSFFPNTYYSKVAYLTFYERGWEYLRTYFQVYPFAAFLPFVVLGAILAPAGMARRYLWGTLCVSGAVFFYVVRLGGDFMEWRFVAPVSGVLFAAIPVGISICAARAGRLLRRRSDRFPAVAGWSAGLTGVAALALITARAEPTARETMMPGQETIGLLRRYCDPEQLDWGSVGKLFDEVLPHDVTIATTSAGIIPFFCDRPCLDLHGLTDPQIAREPVDANDRGRMGHEHWLQDEDEMRRRGVDILLPWAEPKEIPIALVTPPADNRELVSVRMADGRHVEFVVLNPQAVDMDALRNDPRLIFFGSTKVFERSQIYTLREAFGNYVVVDEMDLENGHEEAAHKLQETFDPDGIEFHNWHVKLLRYAPPLDDILVYDDGVIPYQLDWTVSHVAPDSDLIVIARTDQIGNAVFSLEVNGQRVPEDLTLAAGPTHWTETAVSIPAELLVPGVNEIRLRRVGKEGGELYYLWFLQLTGNGRKVNSG